MKKTLSILIALVMIVACVALLSSCGGKATLEGKWTADIDLAAAMGEDLSEAGIDGMVVPMNLEFDDGKVAVSFDADEMRDIMEDVFVSMLGGEDEFEALLEMSGMSKEDALDEMMSEFNSDEMSMKGVYELDGDKLYLGDEEIDKDEYAVIDLSAKKLVIKEIVGVDDSELGSFAEMLPLTFKK